MSAAHVGWALSQRVGSTSRKVVLIALADAVNSHTLRCCPSIARLAEETELNERTVRRCLDDLCGEGETPAVLTRSRTRRSDGTLGRYFYTFPELEFVVKPADTMSGGEGVTSGHSEHQPVDTVSAVEPEVVLDLEPEANLNLSSYSQNGSKPELVEAVDAVRDEWLLNPTLIAHRLSYFKDPGTHRAIQKALRQYGRDDVCAAIASYGKIVASDRHFFNFRWTLQDFLKRGLDRFVPEAEPERNFLITSNGNGHGHGPPPPRMFICPDCEIPLSSQRRLDAHLENVHGHVAA